MLLGLSGRRTLLALAGLAVACSGAEPTPDVEWRSFAADPGASRYAPLDQVDAGNFSSLRVAWSWVSASERWRRSLPKKNRYKLPPTTPINDFQVTPLMVDGALYGVTPIGQVFALDAATGEERWLHDPEAYRHGRGYVKFFLIKHRGVSFWQDPEEPSDRRILLPTPDAFLIALDADSGEPIESFGDGGRVDLLEGLRGPPLERLHDYFQSSPALIVGDVAVVGGSLPDRPQRRRQSPGDLRGYDVRTGALRWTFHVIPAEGEPGTESWEDEAWRYTGAANVWGPMSADPERGLVFATTSTPTNDMYGGHRKGDGLYAETLLALDAASGERRWHFQLIHHGLWDYDPGAPANVIDLVVDGRPLPAVAQVTKQGFVFTFDRETGEPVWPIEERPVPASTVPGEQASPTQPFPTKPPPFERLGVREADAIDFSPELREEAIATIRRFEHGPLFTPPSLAGTLTLPGPSGGANWQGAGVDPETGFLYVPSVTMPAVLSVKEPGPESDLRYVTHESRSVWFPVDGPRSEGVPIFKPPWSRVTAYDMNRGALVWQRANGDGPRDHPRFAGLELPPLGAGARACVLITKSLVIATEGSEILVPHLAEPILHAYDKGSGEEVGRVRLPARSRGCPMSYQRDGVQTIVVPVADEGVAPQLVALRLP